MITDAPIQNAVLHRETVNLTNKPPFLVPINDSVAASERQKHLQVNAARKKITQLKSIKEDTIKRAINDGFMAASIGDLNWLKQTIKVSSDIVPDANGFTTLHLASIHGRLNILKFLIEERQMDPNHTSKFGWRPVHLCINSRIGSKSSECLIYLVGRGADVNVKNDDDIYPLHMAASEGQIECLQILLDLRVNISVVDKRGQTPLDLAKLWGHRDCAKLLTGKVWHKSKKEQSDQEKLKSKSQAQEILKEVERVHLAFYSSDAAKSKENFNIWLNNQGFVGSQQNSSNDHHHHLLASQNKDLIKSSSKTRRTDVSSVKTSMTPMTTSTYNQTNSHSSVNGVSVATGAGKRSKSFRIHEQREQSLYTRDENNGIQDENESSFSYYYQRPELIQSQPSLHNNNNKSSVRLIKKKKKNNIFQPTEAWNSYSKPRKADYINDLKDFYPRDPYTCLPKNLNLVLLNKELRGMSLEQVKEFMDQKLNRPLTSTTTMDEHKPIVYKPRNIVDVPTKAKLTSDDRLVEETGLTLTNDKTTFPYTDAKRFIEQKSMFMTTTKTNDNGLQRIEAHFGPELSEFMKDRRGLLSQKYEKVFIV